MVAVSEGTVLLFRGYRTWYQVLGDPSASGRRLPLLVLHGGPGLPHDYLEDLAVLAETGRPGRFLRPAGLRQVGPS